MFAVAAVLPLAACAHGGKNKKDTAYVARDVSSLYSAAKHSIRIHKPCAAKLHSFSAGSLA